MLHYVMLTLRKETDERPEHLTSHRVDLAILSLRVCAIVNLLILLPYLFYSTYSIHNWHVDVK